MDDHDDGDFSPEHVDIDRLAAYADAGIWLRGSPGPVGSLLRLQLLEELAAAGVPLERLAAAARTNDLQGLRLDLVLRTVV